MSKASARDVLLGQAAPRKKIRTMKKRLSNFGGHAAVRHHFSALEEQLKLIPDEQIFSSLYDMVEIAHSLYTKYGDVFWEWKTKEYLDILKTATPRIYIFK